MVNVDWYKLKIDFDIQLFEKKLVIEWEGNNPHDKHVVTIKKDVIMCEYAHINVSWLAHDQIKSPGPGHNYNKDTNLCVQKCPMFMFMFMFMFDVHNLKHFNLFFLWY